MTFSSNRRFPEITGEDNLTVFLLWESEVPWMEVAAEKSRSAEIFRHGPLIIYTRLPAGGTYYLICMFPASSEYLISICVAFCLWVSVILPTRSVYPQQKHAYSALHQQAWTYIYRSTPEGSYRVQSPGFPKIVYYLCDMAKSEHVDGMQLPEMVEDTACRIHAS